VVTVTVAVAAEEMAAEEMAAKGMVAVAVDVRARAWSGVVLWWWAGQGRRGDGGVLSAGGWGLLGGLLGRGFYGGREIVAWMERC
jgi:hypothetical protein